MLKSRLPAINILFSYKIASYTIIVLVENFWRNFIKLVRANWLGLVVSVQILRFFIDYIAVKIKTDWPFHKVSKIRQITKLVVYFIKAIFNNQPCTSHVGFYWITELVCLIYVVNYAFKNSGQRFKDNFIFYSYGNGFD